MLVSRSSGGGGIGALLFDSTLGAPAASIDTGAGGIAQTQTTLEILILARTDEAGAVVSLNLTVNNDGAAVYDIQRITGINVTASAANAVAGTAWNVNAHGNGGLAGYPSVTRVLIPGYTQTTFFKVGEATNAVADSTAANNTAQAWALGYRSAAAISRFKVAAQGGANLLAGSRLIILGR